MKTGPCCCEGALWQTSADFKGWKALIPSALGTSGHFPLPLPGRALQQVQVVIRPFYLTNSTGMD